MGEKHVSSFAESEHPMNGASKILTVSYGTFSCTLEGFEDPFNTMKAIAEYFRDLAAEDRYFGAEPPQPDAAMLHKIAEREIQRRVEAKVQENGVILRAEEQGAIAAPIVAAPAAMPAAAEPQPVVEMPARVAAAPARPAPTVAQPAPDTAALAEAGAESVAEKLSRLRKAAAESQAMAATATVVTTVAPLMAASAPLVAAQDDFTEDQHADAVPDSVQASELASAAEDDADLSVDMAAFDDLLPEDLAPTADEIVAGDLTPEAQASADNLSDNEIDAEDLADLEAIDAAPRFDEPEADTPDAPDLTAAAEETDAEDEAVEVFEELQVSDTSSGVEDSDDFDDEDDMLLASLAADQTAPAAEVEVEALPATAAADDALLASLASLVDPEEDEETAAPVVTQAAEIESAPTELEATAPEMVADDSDEDDIEAAPEPIDAAFPTPQDDIEFEAETETQDDLPESQADVEDTPDTAQADAEPEDVFATDQDDTTDEVAPVAPVRPVRPVRTLRPTALDRPSVPAALVEELTSDVMPADDDPAPQAPISVEKLQRARARVIKIRRNDMQAVSDNAAPATLSQEAEAALAAELAAVEQDGPAKPEPVVAPAAPEQPAASVPERRHTQPTEDIAVNRLMAEASNQMEVPDTKRRQSAIAHLKAAVAATIAERRATGSTLAGNDNQRMGAYRDDLAKVVRPSAVTAPASVERPAPLVLVSEQRIDRPTKPTAMPPVAAPVQPVRPTRPMTSAALAVEPDLDEADDLDDDAGGNLFEADSGFPDFAERLGASELPDLLEAAAAYIACVEGRDSFTRPQLMRHIGAAAEGLSREDGLRSFGILLRDGVIERSRRGQFAISEASPLLAEARKIAG
ncbi:MAG: hypothetical protein Q8K08_05560 [Pseudotabrizicola sp.]|nr:hypothetical protein [Pseudotabrizicola sp.]